MKKRNHNHKSHEDVAIKKHLNAAQHAAIITIPLLLVLCFLVTTSTPSEIGITASKIYWDYLPPDEAEYNIFVEVHENGDFSVDHHRVYPHELLSAVLTAIERRKGEIHVYLAGEPWTEFGKIIEAINRLESLRADYVHIHLASNLAEADTDTPTLPTPAKARPGGVDG